MKSISSVKDGHMAEVEMKIGEVSKVVGITPRTIRYYEELGLLPPIAHTDGGTRKYTSRDIARLTRIKELQTIFGFSLGDIKILLMAEDDYERLREEWKNTQSKKRQREIIQEAKKVNDSMLLEIEKRLIKMKSFKKELLEKAERLEVKLSDLI